MAYTGYTNSLRFAVNSLLSQYVDLVLGSAALLAMLSHGRYSTYNNMQ